MIFLTVGVSEPFDRLVRTVDFWCSSRGHTDVVGQITDRASYLPVRFGWIARLTPDEYLARITQARFVIAHAGMGSIISAMSLSKPIVLLPRRGHLSETRNDHQYATARRFIGTPGIFVAMSETELPDLLDRVFTLSNRNIETWQISPFASERLITSLREYIHDTKRRPVSRQ